MEIQIAAEGVRHYYDEHANTKRNLHPMLYRCGSNSGQVMQEMTVLLKERPQNVRHCESDAFVADIREGNLLLSLPKFRSSMPATRTSS